MRQQILQIIQILFKSALDDILGGTDTTDQHNSHLYDARCLICKNKSIREAQEKEKLESKLEKEAVNHCTSIT